MNVKEPHERRGVLFMLPSKAVISWFWVKIEGTSCPQKQVFAILGKDRAFTLPKKSDSSDFGKGRAFILPQMSDPPDFGKGRAFILPQMSDPPDFGKGRAFILPQMSDPPVFGKDSVPLPYLHEQKFFPNISSQIEFTGI